MRTPVAGLASDASMTEAVSVEEGLSRVQRIRIFRKSLIARHPWSCGRVVDAIGPSQSDTAASV
jgi:hypothetical protein